MKDTHTRRLRTLLFVPGDRPDRIAKAYSADTDAIAVDLEDAVATSQKSKARTLTTDALAQLEERDVAITVRINALDSEFGEADVIALDPVLPRLYAIVIPMVSDADTIRAAADLLTSAEDHTGIHPGSVGIIPLIETAQGVGNARDIAMASTRVRRLTFGPADLSRQLNITPTALGDELLVARSQVILASAQAGLPQPIDGPYLDLADHDGLVVSAQRARTLGFGGKQVLHPDQLATVSAAFGHTEAEMSWARNVLSAFATAEADGKSSIKLDDGTFVDYPIAARARAILDPIR